MSRRSRSTCARVALLTLVLVMVVTGCGAPATPTAAPAAPTAAPTKAPAAPTAAPAPKTIKIGFMNPLTGGAAFWGLQEKNGVQMAVDEVNAKGGINGAQIVVDYQDDRGDKTEAANVIKRFISDPSVIFVLGPCISGEMFVTGPIANAAEMVQIGMGSAADGIPQIGPYVFRVAAPLPVANPAILAYGKDTLKVQKIALLVSLNNDYSVISNKIFKSAAASLGLQIVAEESYQDGDTNFSAQISKIVAAKPDAVVITGYPTEGTLAGVEARKQGFTGVFLASDGMTDAPTVQKVGGTTMNGMISGVNWAKGVDVPAAKAFEAAYTARWKEDPDASAVSAYDAARMAFAALAKSGPDRKAFRAALAATQNFPGLTGPVGFDPATHEIQIPIAILKYMDGGFTAVALK